jgi:hypothetical protein
MKKTSELTPDSSRVQVCSFLFIGRNIKIAAPIHLKDIPTLISQAFQDSNRAVYQREPFPIWPPVTRTFRGTVACE